jgi:thioester reductase-like protein
MRAHEIWRDTYKPQLRVWAAALDATRMGLTDAEWRELCHPTTSSAVTAGAAPAPLHRVVSIYHCAAFVNWVLPYAALRSANVTGTLEVRCTQSGRGQIFGWLWLSANTCN